jgi:protein-tyrosine-phosphatase
VSTNINSKKRITPVSEMEADTRRVCEIRFDCLVTMHDVAYKKYKGLWGQEKQSKTPQWFRSNQVITLEEIKYADPYELGMRMKQMFNQLEETIKQYEQSR